MAEATRTPVVTSQRSNVVIDHEGGDTLVTLSQQFKIEGDIPTADIYRLMGSNDKGIVTRLVKVAIKNQPALPPSSSPPLQPMHWNGDVSQPTG